MSLMPQHTSPVLTRRLVLQHESSVLTHTHTSLELPQRHQNCLVLHMSLELVRRSLGPKRR